MNITEIEHKNEVGAARPLHSPIQQPDSINLYNENKVENLNELKQSVSSNRYINTPSENKYEFTEAMRREGINCLIEIVADGNLRRFSPDGKNNKNGWYVFFGNGGAFGDWSKGIDEKWSINTDNMSPSERNKINRQIRDAQKTAAEEQLRRHNESACKALSDWNSFSTDGESAYLMRKQVGAFGVRYGSDSFGKFISVPVKDVDGKLWSHQKVYDQKIQNMNTDKLFLKGGRKNGCFHVIGSLEGATTVYVGEGYSTCASIHMAMNKPVIMVFDSGNIDSVVASIKGKHPSLKIVICGDEDQWKEYNTGRKKAEEAAHKYGCSVVFPTFQNTETKPTDFNDLHCLDGLDEVKKQLEAYESSIGNDNSIVIHSKIHPPLPYGFRYSPDGLASIEYQTPDEKWKWMCSNLVVTAKTRDENDDNYGRLLEFTNSDGVTKEWVIPMEDLSGNGEDIRKILLNKGVNINTVCEARNRFNAYISLSNPTEKATCVKTAGWFKGQYVLPDKVYGKQNSERVVLQSRENSQKITRSGSLEEWQSNVGKYIHGNPTLCLAVGAQFAAVFLHLLNEENFIIHIGGGSTSGKTTALHVARSIFGNEINSWRTTDNAAEILARKANDSSLLLDELGEIDAKAADNMAYMLGNGSGKARLNKRGDARPITKFRTIVISTGEVGLESKLADMGKSKRAGQSVRFIEIQSDAECGHGIYKNLHGFNSGEELSSHLKQAVGLYSGTPMDEFLTQLTESPEKRECFLKNIEKLSREFEEKFISPDANPQTTRVFRKFARSAAAIELARYMNIVPRHPEELDQNEPKLGLLSESINECFQSWAKNSGCEKSHELTEIIKNMRSLIDSEKHRFKIHPTSNPDINEYEAPETDNGRAIPNQAGYRIWENGRWNYYIYKRVFYKEVLCGKSHRIWLKTLGEEGEIRRGTGVENTIPFRPRGEASDRFIVISNKDNESS